MNARARELLKKPWFGPLLALVAVYVLFVVLRPDTFARPVNLVTMAQQTVVVAVAAVGMTMIVVLGGIDLSIGSSVALGSVVVAMLLKAGQGPFVAALGGIAVSTCAGAASGLLVTRLQMKPFIVTLGMMSILRGAAKGLAKEQKIDAPSKGLETLLAPLGPGKTWLLFPIGVWIAIAIAIAASVLLASTRFGRHVFAVGSNEATARLCGVRVDRVKVLVYTLGGLLAGIAAVMEFSNLTVGDPTTSIGLELEVIASVVIGGGSLSGGEGSILGAMIGAFLMTVIKTGANYMGWPNWVQEILTGLIILVAVGLDRLRHSRAR